MGYRHYFYEISKSEVEKIKNMNNEKLISYMRETNPKEVHEEGYFNFRDLANQKRIFEFGKLYYNDTAEQIYSCGKPLFSNKETQENYEDYRPFVVGKEGLLKAIEIYQKQIINYYNSLLEDDETLIAPFGVEIPRKISKEEKQERHIKDMLNEWKRGIVINLKSEKESLTNSWKFEYEVFELVRLLKSIDWENRTILFYGW